MRSLKELTTQQNRLFVFLIIQTQLRIENSVFIELNDWDQELRPPISTWLNYLFQEILAQKDKTVNQ